MPDSVLSSSTKTAVAGIIQPSGFPSLPAGWEADWMTYPSAASGSQKTLQLFAQTWSRKKPGSRALLISHGIGEHGGRYLHFPHYLQNSVDVVFAPDHRGHGRSEGLRGFAEPFRSLSEDLVLAIRKLDEKLKQRTGHSEIHVLGHSLGSLILLKALDDHADLPIRSVSLSSPLLALKVKVPAVKRLGAHALLNVWGGLQMSTEFDATLLSHDREVVRAYNKDRLVHRKITPKLFIGMLDAMKEVEAKTGAFSYPVQFLVPMDDGVVDPAAAIAYYQKLENRDKQLKTYPGFFHESFNEVGKEKVFEDFEEWIKAHAIGQSGT